MISRELTEINKTHSRKTEPERGRMADTAGSTKTPTAPPTYPQPSAASIKADPEAAAPLRLEGFDDKAIRRNFIRKVYSILMIQLVLTGGIISCFLFIDSLKRYIMLEVVTCLTSSVC